MIKDGDRVSYAGGRTEYKAILHATGFTGRKYTLVSVKTGRKRYNVPESKLFRWDQQRPVVVTTRGRVARPRNYRSLPSFSGGARETWVGKNWVYKKGHSAWGEERCAVEACRYFLQRGNSVEDAAKKFGKGIAEEAETYSKVPIAECYLLEDGTLMMERVLPVRSLQAGYGAPSMTQQERTAAGLGWDGDKWPEWSCRVDSRQIGLDRKGKIVAYDL